MKNEKRRMELMLDAGCVDVGTRRTVTFFSAIISEKLLYECFLTAEAAKFNAKAAKAIVNRTSKIQSKI